MDKTEKIKKLLESIKLEVDDVQSFEKDIDSILGMFDQLKDIDTGDASSTLNRKKITIDDLREDIPAESPTFRPEMKGNYFKVPNVSKKD